MLDEVDVKIYGLCGCALQAQRFAKPDDEALSG